MTLPVPRHNGTAGRWSPLWEFDDVHDQMNRLVASVLGSVGAVGEAGAAAWTPPTDVTETEDAWLVEIDVPGLRRDDITVEATGSYLAVAGEYKEKERAGWRRSRTRRVGRFEYRTSLPTHVDVDRITADLADGVLTVRLPKSERARPRRIAINGG